MEGILNMAWNDSREREITRMLEGEDDLIKFTSELISAWRVMEVRRQEDERMEERLLKQAMLAMEWKTRRMMMMEIDPAEMFLAPSQDHSTGDIDIIDGMRMLTVWTDNEWNNSNLESIEHRNMDIIMEDLGVTMIDNCMEVDVEMA